MLVVGPLSLIIVLLVPGMFILDAVLLPQHFSYLSIYLMGWGGRERRGGERGRGGGGGEGGREEGREREGGRGRLHVYILNLLPRF